MKWLNLIQKLKTNTMQKTKNKTTIQIGKEKPQECDIIIHYSISRARILKSHKEFFLKLRKMGIEKGK